MFNFEKFNHTTSIWDSVASSKEQAHILDRDISADIIIIGAGIVGLSSALHMAKNGHKVVVIEGRRIGSAASGRNNGQVIPVLSGAEPDEIIKRYGEVGERFVALIRDSANYLFQLAKDENIECEAEQTGWFQPAHSLAHLSISEWRNSAWQKYGAPCKMLDRDQASAMIGSKNWYGGMLNPTGGHINPLMFTQGLAKAAKRYGVQIFENSPALTIQNKGDSWQVSTKHGQVKGNKLLLATNAYSDDLVPNLQPKVAKSIVPVISFQLATKPLNKQLQNSIIPKRQAISDTRGDLQYFRYDARNRLISGGALIYKGNAKQRLKKLVGNRLATAFPQMGRPEFTHIWSGYIGVSQDRFPHFYQLGDGFWSWSGCNGRGLALAASLGREFAAIIDGKTDIALPLSEPKPFAFHSVARKLAPSALAYYRWKDKQKPKKRRL